VDENEDNVVQLSPAKTAPDAPLTADEQSATRTVAVQVQDHLFEHRVKYVLGSLVPLLIVLLQNWGTICPALPLKLNCGVTGIVATQVQKQLEASGGGDATP
jgi:MFS superfamily sulfate permease-like transporter